MAGITRELTVRHPLRLELQGILCTLVLGLVGLCVVYPIFLVVEQSFQTAAPGQAATWGLEGWRAAFHEPLLRSALLNTLRLTLTRQAVTLPVAVGIAWLLGRTDLPGRSWFEFAFWVAFFLPPLTVTLSWILMLDPNYGLANQVIAGFLHLKHGPFNIYSFWGIVWVYLVTASVTVKVILLTPAFRYMNSSFEEASRVTGASTIGTALRITIPVMAPVILAVLLLGTMVSLQAFEVEQVLGVPFRFFVFSTMIYDLVVTRVPRYDAATALAVTVLMAMLPLIVLQLWVSKRRQYTTVTGQFKSSVVRLGRARWPLAALMGAVVATMLGVPLALSALGTFMKLFGFFTIKEPWTLNNWQTVLQDPVFLASLKNTLELAVGTAVAALLVYSVIAYIAVRTRYRGRRALDFFSWLPFTVPGLILGLALLWLFLGVAIFRPLYGSMWLLILAGILTGMPLGVQIIKGSLLQLGGELEEASRLAGASWWTTYRRIILRLLAPALLAVGLILFVGAARNIGYIALLSTSSNEPLSILQLNYIAQGKLEVASVIAFIIMLTSLACAFLARALGFKGAAF